MTERRKGVTQGGGGGMWSVIEMLSILKLSWNNWRGTFLKILEIYLVTVDHIGIVAYF